MVSFKEKRRKRKLAKERKRDYNNRKRSQMKADDASDSENGDEEILAELRELVREKRHKNPSIKFHLHFNSKWISRVNHQILQKVRD